MDKDSNTQFVPATVDTGSFSDVTVKLGKRFTGQVMVTAEQLGVAIVALYGLSPDSNDARQLLCALADRPQFQPVTLKLEAFLAS